MKSREIYDVHEFHDYELGRLQIPSIFLKVNFVSVGGKMGALGNQSATWRNTSMNTVFLGK